MQATLPRPILRLTAESWNVGPWLVQIHSTLPSAGLYPVSSQVLPWDESFPDSESIPTAPAACPGCGTSPAYRRKLADPWDTHEACPECSHCYTHGGAS
jgi:hypothetical protein